MMDSRPVRPQRSLVAGGSPRPAAPARPQAPPRVGDLQDTLGALTDRADLERLFEKAVDINRILRLMGHGASREEILALLASPRLDEDLKKFGS